jgi:ankyrin repeat protein
VAMGLSWALGLACGNWNPCIISVLDILPALCLSGGCGCAGPWDAAAAGDLSEVQRLVGHDPRLLNGTNYYNRTPLMLAAEGGHVAVVRWLVDRGAAVGEHSKNGYTALCYASYQSHSRVVRLLLERGADPTIADECGRTPLIRAIMGGHLGAVRCLLKHPSAAAAIDHRDWGGMTALLWACTHGRESVVRALLDKGATPPSPPGGARPRWTRPSGTSTTRASSCWR